MDLFKIENGPFSTGFLEGLGKVLGAALGSLFIALTIKVINNITDNQNSDEPYFNNNIKQ